MTRQAIRETNAGILTTALVAGALAASILAGCGGLELESRWRDREVAIDGRMSGDGEPGEEWAGARAFLEDENASIGLLNDESSLYIRLETKDRRMQMHIVRLGLSVWFDPRGGKDKVFGIRFPLGAGGVGVEGGGMGFARRSGRESPDPERMRQDLESTIQAMTELEILGPGDEVERIPMGEAQGIEVAIALSETALAYELRVPFHETLECPYAVGAEPGDRIGLRLETSGMDFGRMGGVRPHIRVGIGQPGGRMGRGVGRGGPGRPEPLDVWASVQLAAAEGSSPETREAGLAVTVVED